MKPIPIMDRVVRVADAMGLDIHEQRDGTYSGCKSVDLRINATWEISPKVTLVSDQVNELSCSFLIHFGGALWGYLISNANALWLLYMDADKLPASPDKMLAGDSRKSCEGFRRGATRALKCKLQEKEWSEIDVATMVGRDEGRPVEGTGADAQRIGG